MRRITVNDKMQIDYTYACTKPVGRHFDPRFKPELTPREMLQLGVFGGRYMRDCTDEFPRSWFTRAKLHPEGAPGHSKELNFFGVDASQPLSVWQEKGWIHAQDPRGWFQWYCRCYQGRRSEDDSRQIQRSLGIRRHATQVRNHCRKGDLHCRRKQRQALLHWAYDSRRI